MILLTIRARFLAIGALVALGLAGSAGASPRRFLVLPDSLPIFGHSVTDWTVGFWRWLSSVPADESPEVALEADCGVDQHGPVFYVPPFQASSYERTCDVRFGKLVLVPVQAVLNSYPCPDPSFQPAPGQTLEDFLQEGAIGFNDLYSQIHVTIDGHAVDIGDHRDTTPLFTNTVDPSLLPFLHDDCLTGAAQPAVADGWYLVVLFAPGAHQVVVTALNPGGQPVSRSYDIDVAL